MEQELVCVSGDFVLWKGFEELEELLSDRIRWVKDETLHGVNDDRCRLRERSSGRSSCNGGSEKS